MNKRSSLCSMDFCSYDVELEYVWVHDMAMDQIAEQLKPHDNRVKAVNLAFSALPELSFLDAIYKKYARLFFLDDRSTLISPSEAPCVSLRSQEKEQEKEKEKEKEKKELMSGKPDTDPQKSFFCFDKNRTQAQEPSSQSELKTQATEILEFLNAKTGRRYRLEKANLKLIMARLRTGATVMDCRQVIAKKTREWKGNAKMEEYLRPATLFNAEKFEQYLGELVLPKEHVHESR